MKKTDDAPSLWTAKEHRLKISISYYYNKRGLLFKSPDLSRSKIT